MSVVTLNHERPEPAADATAAFWAAAHYCDDAVGKGGFDGKLQQFGFVLDDTLPGEGRIKAAMDVLHKVLPEDTGLVPPNPTELTQYQYLHSRWAGSGEHLFWAHPDEPSFAITCAHRFNRPHGDESATLLNFAAPSNGDAASARQREMLSLAAAQSTPRQHPQFFRHDSFTSQSDGTSGTYRFAKSHSTTGRDRADYHASGATLTSRGPALLDAVGAPFLFLHLASAYIAI